MRCSIKSGYLRKWLDVAVVLVAATATLGLADDSDGKSDESDRYITVQGWAVHGYSGGRDIGYQWYREKGDAVEAKKRMEEVRTTDGKYYDKVEIEPEERRVYIGGNSARSEQEPLVLPGSPGKPSIRKPSIPTVDVKPSVSAPASPKLEGTKWSGSENGQGVRFAFGPNGQVQAFDSSGTWNGTWRMVTPTRFVIELTEPNRVNYVGTING